MLLIKDGEKVMELSYPYSESDLTSLDNAFLDLQKMNYLYFKAIVDFKLDSNTPSVKIQRLESHFSNHQSVRKAIVSVVKDLFLGYPKELILAGLMPNNYCLDLDKGKFRYVETIDGVDYEAKSLSYKPFSQREQLI